MNASMRRIVASSFAALIVSACRTDVPADSAKVGATRDSAGIAIVEHRGEPTGSITIRDKPSLSIGSAGGSDTAVLFTYIKGAIRLSDGTIVVMERDDTRWFDSTGHHLRTTTRKGDGPGEFRSLHSLFRLAGDSVVVSGGEYGPHKQATFAPDGRFAHEERLDVGRYRMLGDLGECQTTLPDRSWLDCTSIPDPDPKPDDERTVVRFVRVPASLGRVYELGVANWAFYTQVTLGGRKHTARRPFTPLSVTEPAAAGGTPMRIAIATGPAYQVNVWSDTGKLERIIRRLDGRVPVTDEDRAAHERSLRNTPGMHPADLEKVLKAVPPPDSMPGIASIVVASTGAFFVKRYTRVDKTIPTRVDVFDAEGAFVATLTLPPRFRLLDAGADYLLGVRQDDDDVPFVELYPLRTR
jgi:hypothetical protein